MKLSRVLLTAMGSQFMPNLEMAGNPSQTLAQRMAKGRIPVLEALRYAAILADSLRKIHDSGQAHGAVTPSCVALTRTGLDLLPDLGSTGIVTTYTAPEVVKGKPADSRSDIFSFGAILYEMLKGRAPFHGENPIALADAIMTAAVAPSGSPAVDRMVAGCLAKEPGARFPRVQKLVLELKLLAVAVRRAETPGARPQHDAVLRAEMQQIEARINGRLARYEQSLEAVNDRLGRLEQLVHATAERTGRLEQALESAFRDGSGLRESVSEDLGSLDKALKAQAASIESVKTAVSQTDDLVERVVEALESLQSAVLDPSDERNPALS